MGDGSWRPLAGQRAFLRASAPVKVLACGRRWGKSEVAAREVYLGAISGRAKRQIIVAPSYDQACLIFERVVQMLREEGGPPFSVTRQPYPMLDIRPCRVTARSAARGGALLRGQGADRVVVDEAAYVPEAVINEVVMPMLAESRGRLALLSTPCGRNHFHRAFERGQAGDSRFWSLHGATLDHALIGRDYLDAQREMLTDRQFRTEYGAEFLEHAQAVFSQAWIERAVGLDFGDEVSSQSCALGVDWARYRDFTAVVILQGSQEKCRMISGDRFNGLAWSAQLDRVAATARLHAVADVLCDRTSVGDPLLEQLQIRLPRPRVDGIVFTNESKRALIDRLVLTLERERMQLEPHIDLLRELYHFEHQISATGTVTLNAASGYHDDMVIALALALAALPESGQPPRFVVASRRREFSSRL